MLVIHGTEDEVIDFSHGLAMYERCPRAVDPLWVEGAGHNDVELYGQYLDRLKQFISVELPINWRHAESEISQPPRETTVNAQNSQENNVSKETTVQEDIVVEDTPSTEEKLNNSIEAATNKDEQNDGEEEAEVKKDQEQLM